MDVTKIVLLPIARTPDENVAFIQSKETELTLAMTIGYYRKIGFEFPWIGYFAAVDGILIGSCGFKGGPVNGKVEIAYGVITGFERMGIGTELCRQLTGIARQHDPSVCLTARTMPDNRASAAVLKKNGYTWKRIVMDEDDGEVWEWEFEG